jgi:hypothetical protein
MTSRYALDAWQYRSWRALFVEIQSFCAQQSLLAIVVHPCSQAAASIGAECGQTHRKLSARRVVPYETYCALAEDFLLSNLPM